jgi:hypothetical protein
LSVWLRSIDGASDETYEEDRQELNDQHALEQEVELPASSCDAEWDGVLVQEQADVGTDVLHQQTVGTDLVAENLQWVGDVQGNPMNCQ